LEIQEQIEAGKLNEVSAPADYEKMEWVEKNQSKYFATFPYPYMNGYLHLGKFY
jgi:leucyl-tRNA synthetase